jgi:hypothetical protein
MSALKTEREATLAARREGASGFERAMENRKRKLDERREMLQRRRVEVFGKEEVDRIDRERQEMEADNFLKGLEKELEGK